MRRLGIRRTAAVGRLVAGAAICLATSLATACQNTDRSVEQPVTAIADLLSGGRFEPDLTVTIRGVVTFKPRLWEGLVIQDDTAGIWIEVTRSRRLSLLETDIDAVMELREGDCVEVVGRPNRGGYAPNVVPMRVRKIGERPLPAARPYDPGRFFHGLDDCLRVEAAGIVRGFRDDVHNDRWLFLVDDATRQFWADVAKTALAEPPERYVDTTIRFAGVAIADFNSRGEMLMPRLGVSRAEDLRIEGAPSEVREVALADIGRYPDLAHRVRTQGVVTHAEPGSFLVLQSGFAGVVVETTSTERWAAGDVVEAVGFIDAANPVSGLSEAHVHRLRPGSPPDPIAIHPADIIRVNAQALSRYETADPGDYYGCLVTFPATVIDVTAGRTGGEVRLVADEIGLTAVSGLLGLIQSRSLETGSLVQVTGIVRPTGTKHRYSTTGVAGATTAPMEILLRSPADLRLLRAPSWWKPRRLAAVIAALGATVLGVLGWVVGLRRQVARQVGIIEDKLQIEAVAGERLRIAREFHDTLEQDLAGIALRLDAAADLADDERTRRVLEQQRGLLEQVRRETHDFLWDLRDPTRTDGSLVESLAAQTAFLQSLTNVPVRLQLLGSSGRLSAEAQFHLLRIVRESVTNALKHGDPTRVDVRLRSSAAGKTVEITDDGRGFDVAACAALEGHFGLRGMRERALRIDAQLTIESVPGAGTTVRLFVPDGPAA